MEGTGDNRDNTTLRPSELQPVRLAQCGTNPRGKRRKQTNTSMNGPVDRSREGEREGERERGERHKKRTPKTPMLASPEAEHRQSCAPLTAGPPKTPGPALLASSRCHSAGTRFSSAVEGRTEASIGILMTQAQKLES